MPAINRPVMVKSLLVQLLGVAVLGLATGLALPHSFFASWGWLVGPAAWMLAAAFTARVVRLPYRPALIGAVIAGVSSAIATIVGLHWLGALLAVAVFGLWCGALGARIVTSG